MVSLRYAVGFAWFGNKRPDRDKGYKFFLFEFKAPVCLFGITRCEILDFFCDIVGPKNKPKTTQTHTISYMLMNRSQSTKQTWYTLLINVIL